MAAPTRAAAPPDRRASGNNNHVSSHGTEDRVSLGAHVALTATGPPLGCHELALAAIERRHGGDLLAVLGELVLRVLVNDGAVAR